MDHEEEFLNHFFIQVAQLCSDKAKESVEKERESCRQTQMGPWGMLLMHLPQIALAERSYADLCFLQTKNKSFLRKDNSLKTIYECLKSDLKRVEEMTRGTNAIGATVAEVSCQLCFFITARIQLMDLLVLCYLLLTISHLNILDKTQTVVKILTASKKLKITPSIKLCYEKIYNMSTSNKPMKYQELLQSIETIMKTHSLSCSHLTLIAIKTTLTLECEILAQLIKAEVEAQNWKFLSALMCLYGAQTRMVAWERTLQSKESWKLGFGATFLKANQQPALYQWLMKLKNAILAKCSLYFHSTLSQQTSLGEIKSILSKQNVDYYHKIQNFQRKHDLLGMLIVFDCRGENIESGYRHPDRKSDSSESFSVIVSCPTVFIQKSLGHWDDIQNGIKERHSDLLAMDKIIYIKNLKHFCTYAMYNIDPRMTLVTAFENGKQRDKETHVAAFMMDLSVQIRCNKVYECLKLTK